MKPPLRETLMVYWDGEEVPGFTIYALGPPALNGVPDIRPSLADLPATASNFLLGGEDWLVRAWDIRMDWWPTTQQFNDIIERVFRSLRQYGFQVVWIGVEGHFVDPPSLFDPDFQPDGILAATSRATGLVTSLDLDKPLVSLPVSIIMSLREAGEGLANACS